MTLWVEVEDLFAYAHHHHRVSGIQRVSLGVIEALLRVPGADVRFTRRGPGGQGFIGVPRADVLALAASFDQVARADAPKRRVPGSWMGRSWDAATGWMPPRLEDDLRRLLIAEMLRARRLRDRWLPRSVGYRDEASLERYPLLSRVARRGDVLLVLGSPWDQSDYASQIARLRARRGVRLAVMMHDLIPLLHPEWCDRGIINAFSGWTGSVLPLADHVFANSRSTARDVEGWADREGVRIARPVRVLPMGTGFSAPPEDAQGLTERVREATERPYVLFVSTVEARKNHLLAFRAWRELLRELPPERVPRLVFAGRVGWLVSDLMQQLENADWLEGHVELVRDPTDAELAALYRGCRFTLFPSLYEGWGLPVSESLSFGKVCVASGKTSVPEAGGEYCLYHDPNSVTEAVALLRRVIEQPELIAEREAALRRDFRPTPWSDAAHTILDILGEAGKVSPDSDAEGGRAGADAGALPGRGAAARGRDAVTAGR